MVEICYVESPYIVEILGHAEIQGVIVSYSEKMGPYCFRIRYPVRGLQSIVGKEGASA